MALVRRRHREPGSRSNGALRLRASRTRRVGPERFEVKGLVELCETLDGKRTVGDLVEAARAIATTSYVSAACCACSKPAISLARRDSLVACGGAIALVLACGCYHASFEQNVPCAADLSCPGSRSAIPARVAAASASISSAATTGSSVPTATSSSTARSPRVACVRIRRRSATWTSTTCRGCYNDGECSSGVCIEYTGTCVPRAARALRQERRHRRRHVYAGAAVRDDHARAVARR